MMNNEAIKLLERQKIALCHDCMHPQSVRWCEEHCMLPEAFDMAIEALKATACNNLATNLQPCKQDGDDLIRRQAAIRVASGYCHPANIVKELERLPSADGEVKSISYTECANAMLKMWMDKVITDGEYNRIMEKLNSYWRKNDG